MAKKNIITMTFEEWEEKYKPVRDAHNEIKFFETYGEDAKVVSKENVLKVWTLLDGDNDKTYLEGGLVHVNRLNYIITAVPREPDDEIVFEY